MAARSSLLVSFFCVAAVAASLTLAAALPERMETQPLVENSKFQFEATINANAVNIRSGTSENYYPVAKLDRGVRVTVVGIRQDWLKIVPPEGTYSVISKAFVTREGNTSVGIVAGENVRVRAASTLSPLKVTVQCMLKKGTPVTILGEEEEYYQIKPPADAYLYVHQKYVDPVKQLNAKPGTVDTVVSEGPATQAAVVIVPNVPANDEAAARRAADKAEADFDRAEALLKDSLDKPLDQQPIERLVTGYEAVLKSDHLSVPMRRIAEIRLIGLRGKAKAQQELLAMRKQQEKTNQKLDALRAERAAIEDRMASGLTVYTALGTLQASTLQIGSGTLYRLTDPGTGRALCYVRSDDPKYPTFIDKFVGVRGELLNDPQVNLQVVVPTEITTVDPAKVNKSLTAQVSPPSLIAKPAEHADTGKN